MTPKTETEISAKISLMKKLLECMPDYNAFGESNYALLHEAIEVLEGAPIDEEVLREDAGLSETQIDDLHTIDEWMDGAIGDDDFPFCEQDLEVFGKKKSDDL